jgi:hypothetical protein
MAYLDVSPMIAALRDRPDDFEMHDGSLRHLPSRHDFYFGPHGILIDARCSCAHLSVVPDQATALRRSYDQWHASYWRPLEINREFASHFRPHSAVRQVLIDAVNRLLRYLTEDRRSHRHDGYAVPAE